MIGVGLISSDFIDLVNALGNLWIYEVSEFFYKKGGLVGSL